MWYCGFVSQSSSRAWPLSNKDCHSLCAVVARRTTVCCRQIWCMVESTQCIFGLGQVVHKRLKSFCLLWIVIKALWIREQNTRWYMHTQRHNRAPVSEILRGVIFQTEIIDFSLCVVFNSLRSISWGLIICR